MGCLQSKDADKAAGLAEPGAAAAAAVPAVPAAAAAEKAVPAAVPAAAVPAAAGGAGAGAAGAPASAQGLKRVVVVGAGFGGLSACQALSGVLDDAGVQVEVTLVDKKREFSVGASWQYVLTGRMSRGDTVRPLSQALLHAKVVRLFGAQVDAVDAANKRVELTDESGARRVLQYDYCILCPGMRSVGDAIPGLSEHCLDMCSPSTCEELARRVRGCKGGETVVVLTSALPYKCPPAIFEYAFLIDEMLRGQGVRDKVSLVVTSPAQPVSFGGPNVAEAFMASVKAKDIQVLPFVRPVKAAPGVVELVSTEGAPAGAGQPSQIKADVLVGMYPQLPPDVFKPLCNDKGFIPALDPFTCETRHEGLFAVGDANWLMLETDPPKPHPKAGEFAANQGAGAAQMVSALLRGKSPEQARLEVRRLCDRTCFAEAGNGTAIPINFILGSASAGASADAKPAKLAPRFITDVAKDEHFARKEAWLRGTYKTFFGDEPRIDNHASAVVRQ